MLYEIKIWRQHEKHIFDGEDYLTVPLEGDLEYHKFKVSFDTSRVRIDGFESYVLFDNNNSACECTRVFLSNETEVYARRLYDSFKKWYNETYLPMIPKNLEDIVKDLENETPE